MKSKTQLFKDLATLNLPEFANILEKKLDHDRIGNETYGRDSRIYVHFADHTQRRQMERKLEQLGHKVRPDYWPGSKVAEVSVSYFKGVRWDV